MEERKRVGPKWLDDSTTDDKSTVKKSKKHEMRLAQELGGKRQARSGANRFSVYDGDKRTMNRDIETPEFFIEHKFTEKQSISLKKEWLDGITESATLAFKKPMVIVTFMEGKESQDWAVIPLHIFKLLTED